MTLRKKINICLSLNWSRENVWLAGSRKEISELRSLAPWTARNNKLIFSAQSFSQRERGKKSGLKRSHQAKGMPDQIFFYIQNTHFVQELCSVNQEYHVFNLSEKSWSGNQKSKHWDSYPARLSASCQLTKQAFIYVLVLYTVRTRTTTFSTYIVDCLSSTFNFTTSWCSSPSSCRCCCCFIN